MRRFSALGLLFTPTSSHAQTLELQQQIERKLWVQRALAWIEATVGTPPALTLSMLLALVLALVASNWWWSSRRNRPK